MATANRSGDDRRTQDDDPDRTQRLPALQEVVDRWFTDKPDEPADGGRMDNRTARRMTEQHQRGEPTTGRPGCWPFVYTVASAVALAWAVR